VQSENQVFMDVLVSSAERKLIILFQTSLIEFIEL
jgi:hypothetical protein